MSSPTPSDRVDEKFERLECVVCCEEIDPSKTLRLPCKHCYHASCMNDWAQQQAGGDVSCPQCRYPVSQEILQELQKPISYADMVVLPIILLVMAFETLYGWLQIGCMCVKGSLFRMSNLFMLASSTALRGLRITLAVIREASVNAAGFAQGLKMWSCRKISDFTDLAFGAAESVWQGIRCAMIAGCFRFRDMTIHAIYMLREQSSFLWQSVRPVLIPIRDRVVVEAYLASYRVGHAVHCFLRSCRHTLALAVKLRLLWLSHTVAGARVALQCIQSWLQRAWHFFMVVADCAHLVFDCVYAVVCRRLRAIVDRSKHWLADYVQASRRFCYRSWQAVAVAITHFTHRVRQNIASALARGYARTRDTFRIVSSCAEAIDASVVKHCEQLRMSAKAHVIFALHTASRAASSMRQEVQRLLLPVFSRAWDMLYAGWQHALHLAQISFRSLHTLFVAIQSWTGNLVASMQERISATMVFSLLQVTDCWQSLQNVASRSINASVKQMEQVSVAAKAHTTVALRATSRAAGSVWEEGQRLMLPVFSWSWDMFYIAWQHAQHLSQISFRNLRTLLVAIRSWTDLLVGSMQEHMSSAMGVLLQQARRLWQLFKTAVSPLCACIRDHLLVVMQKAAEVLRKALQSCGAAAQVVKEQSISVLQAVLRSLLHHGQSFCSAVAQALDQFGISLSNAVISISRAVTISLMLTVQEFYWFLYRVADMIWRCVCFFARCLMELVHTFAITVRNITFRPRCSVCERGCAKVRSLCFTCAVDHLVPRCSDCGHGWCKIQSRCFSCFIDHYFEDPRCAVCSRGFKKFGSRCTTCFLDRFFCRCASCERGYQKFGRLCTTCFVDRFVSRCGVCGGGYGKFGGLCLTCFIQQVKTYLRNPPRCGVCGEGFSKIGSRCVTCSVDQYLGRCVACHQGYQKFGGLCASCYLNSFQRCRVCQVGSAKIGTRCFSCLRAHVVDYIRNPPKCSLCHQGCQKIGERCLTCYVDSFLHRCIVCKRGYQKLGNLCTSCYVDRCCCRCGVCQQGYAKFGTRCFSCFKAHIFHFPRCGVCQRGSAKIGTRCFTCFKAHMLNYPRCAICHRGSAKVGSRCLTCFKAHIKDMLRNPPRCAICERGCAKIGARCFTCYRALLSQPAQKVAPKVAGKGVPNPKELLRLR